MGYVTGKWEVMCSRPECWLSSWDIHLSVIFLTHANFISNSPSQYSFLCHTQFLFYSRPVFAILLNHLKTMVQSCEEGAVCAHK